MQLERNAAFGRLLAIANVLSQRVVPGYQNTVHKHMDRYQKTPAKAFVKIHEELMEFAYKFGPDELALLDMFGEIMADMDPADFTNEPLTGKYLHAYHTEQHYLNNVITAEDAAKRWGLTAGYIKNLCAEGRVKAKKLGTTWAIDGTQANPKTYLRGLEP